ncbi:MAG: BREX-6 system BrxE protein [Myxococcales bacterium]|nr:BREX-6 system BrxE protein [Myxococcales bacterium]
MADLFENVTAPVRYKPAALTTADIDAVLTAQFIVAWAGESGEEHRRLGWWKSDLVAEDGGEALLRTLLPVTWPWAVLQAVRETARRRDAELRRQDSDPDRLLTIFHLGFEVDERVDERIQELKREGRTPTAVLPDLSLLQQPWSRDAFQGWVASHGEVETAIAPAGRHVKGRQPAGVTAALHALVAGLAPLSDGYPMPHFRRGA